MSHIIPMNKPARLNLIANICCRFSAAPVRALPVEIKEEIALAKVHDDDQSIIDVDVEVAVISPQLAAIIEPKGRAHRVKTDDWLLTAQEHRQLAAERAEYRKRFWLALPMPQIPWIQALNS